MTLQYSCIPFQELTLEDLYAIIALREEVFVVEQDCPYLDADGKDLHGFHLCGKDNNGVLQAYARILDKGVSYADYPSLGRIVTRKSYRRKGAGIELMNALLKETKRLFPGMAIKISAQCYLQEFYERFGFQQIGETYLEDGIPHIAMIKNK